MPATLALGPIYAAIVSKLKGDATLITLLASGSGSVFNVAGSGSTFPYVEVGAGTQQPFNTMGPDGSAKWGGTCTVQITGRSQSVGAGSDLPLLTIMSRVIAVLVGQELIVAGFPSVSVELDSVPPMFTDVVDSKPTRTQAVIVRVTVHEGAR